VEGAVVVLAADGEMAVAAAAWTMTVQVEVDERPALSVTT
jgi:hypothetical protein